MPQHDKMVERFKKKTLINKRTTTDRRHELARSIFRKYYDQEEQGRKRHSFDYCVMKTASETGYTEGYLMKILK